MRRSKFTYENRIFLIIFILFTYEKVCEDIELMLENCRIYNNPNVYDIDGGYFELAQIIQKDWNIEKKKILKLPLDISAASTDTASTQSQLNTASTLGDGSAQSKILHDALKYLRNIDVNKNFHFPVYLSGYSDVIMHPMDYYYLGPVTT